VTIVTLTSPDEQQAAVWRLAHEISYLFAGLPWVLVGGLMVQLHEAAAGRVSAFATGDLDAVVDVRAQDAAMHVATDRLLGAGFQAETQDDRLIYRFRRASDVVDILAPDHLGLRADITTLPPGRTLQAVGARQAINRRRVITVDAGEGPFELPVPSLIAAIVIKTQVVDSVGSRASRAKHERDLARLLALVTDPVGERRALTHKERGYLSAREALLDTSHRAWRGVIGAADGGTALRILGDVDDH